MICRYILIESIKLLQSIDIVHPDTKICTATLVIGLVKMIHVRNDVYNQETGEVKTEDLQVISRLGDSYARLGDGFKLKSGNWAKDEESIRQALSQQRQK